MRRRVFSFASGLSPLLLVASVVLWVRSYWVSDEWDRITYSVKADIARRTMLNFSSGAGGFRAELRLDDNSDPRLLTVAAQQVPTGSSWSWTTIPVMYSRATGLGRVARRLSVGDCEIVIVPMRRSGYLPSTHWRSSLATGGWLCFPHYFPWRGLRHGSGASGANAWKATANDAATISARRPPVARSAAPLRCRRLIR